MPIVSHEVEAACPFSLAWDLLVEKVRAPQRFVGSTDVTILADGDGSASSPVHRVMKLGPRVIEEHIYWHQEVEGEKGVVDFRWVPGHPMWVGSVLNKLEKVDDSRVRIRFEMNWQLKEGAPEPPAMDYQAAITGAVEKTKGVCEAAAAAAAGH